jgi:hypothetical protein
VPVSALLSFAARECLDIGTCLGSPVSMDYYGKPPSGFTGMIERMHVEHLQARKASPSD